MSVAILHEGKKVDRAFFELLIDHLNLNKSDIVYFPFRSKSNFFKVDYKEYIDLKSEIDTERITKVLFILDADNKENDCKYGGCKNTIKELRLIREKLEILDKSDYCITKDPNEDYGYLESLILSTVSIEEKECINKFLECSNYKAKENHKAILNEIYKLAYPNAPYDFNHSNFDELKNKLNKLFGEC